MSYMLSAQLPAMELNVEAGFVTSSSLVYAPGVPGANPLGFISISNLMAGANTELGVDGNTPARDPERANQEGEEERAGQSEQQHELRPGRALHLQLRRVADHDHDP
jgi:hypothetical protein